MLIVRLLVIMLLLTAVGLFAVYASTGNLRYRHYGLMVLKWTIFAGLLFFAVMVIEQLT